MYCVKCGKEIPNDSKVCPECGALAENAKFCQHCGEAIDKDCIVCPKCGKQVQQLNRSSLISSSIIITATPVSTPMSAKM